MPRSALVGAIPVLVGIGGSDEHAIRVWGLAGTIGVALGPAFGGFLTELFSWRSIFLLQAPLAALALVAVVDPRVRAVERAPHRNGAPRTGLANAGFLALYGALVGALFLSVLLLVVVWGWSPIAGALVVTTLPVGTIAVRQLVPGLPHRGRGCGRRDLARGRVRRARVSPRVDRRVGRGGVGGVRRRIGTPRRRARPRRGSAR